MCENSGQNQCEEGEPVFSYEAELADLWKPKEQEEIAAA